MIWTEGTPVDDMVSDIDEARRLVTTGSQPSTSRRCGVGCSRANDHLASIPSPERRCLAPRRLPGPRLRPVHHPRRHRRGLGRRPSLGRTRRLARAWSATSRSGRSRSGSSAAGSTTCSPTRSSTSARARSRSPRSTSGAAGSASGARSRLGALGAYIGCRRDGCRFGAFADALAPGIVLAQAIGRWGNWFNQELYGKPTDLPWGLEIDPAHRGGYAAVHDLPPDVPVRVLWDVGVAGLVIWARPQAASSATAGRSRST